MLEDNGKASAETRRETLLEVCPMESIRRQQAELVLFLVSPVEL